METIKILFVNTGVIPIQTKKMEMPSDNSDTIKKNILDNINAMGKRAHALVQFKNKHYVCEHTEQSGVSVEYKRREIKYHPFMKELA